MTQHSTTGKNSVLLFEYVLLVILFSVFAGCESKGQGASNTRSHGASSRSSSIPILPRDPRATLQPLAPGYTWTYKVSVKGQPKLCRWFTKDGRSGGGFSSVGLFAPMDERGDGDYRVRFTVLNETKVLPWAKQNKFYKVSMTDAVSGTDLTEGETLYWGRYRYDSALDLAVCELRAIGPTAGKILENALDFPKRPVSGFYHLRYLTKDFAYGWPQKGQVTVGTMTLSEPDAWEVKTAHPRWETVSVPSGTFKQVVSTTFRFHFSEIWVTETLYYKAGVGLVKWVQTEDGDTTVEGQLVNYNIGH